MTSRPEAIKQLYRGGLAAILTELIVIAALMLYTLAFWGADYNESLIDYDPEFSTNSLDLDGLLTLVENRMVLYQTASFMFVVLSSFVMLFVIGAWHVYLSSEGIHFISWMTSLIGLLGVGLMLAAGSINSAGVVFVDELINQGELSDEALLLTLALGMSVFLGGVMLLYFFYPIGLLLIAWRNRLFPRKWLAVGLVLFLLFNGTSLMVLSPFFLGVIMLTHAQSLAKDLTQSPSQQTAPTQ